jgi:hypothetical protein
MKFSRKYRAGLILSQFTIRNGKKNSQPRNGFGEYGTSKGSE